MMPLYEQLKKARMAAMKDGLHLSKRVLTTFVGELQTEETRGTEITDDLVIKRIKKNSQVCRENYELTGEDNFLKEAEILEFFLPTQLSEKDLEKTIDLIMGGESNIKIGDVMKELNARFSGRFDGKVASKMIKEKLSN